MIEVAPRVTRTSSIAPRGRSAVAPSARRATAADLPGLARLINGAHAVESYFAVGDRVDVATLTGLREHGHFLVLDGDDGELAAAVYVRCDAARGTIALLSVAPGHQGRGLGRRLVAVAEALCAAVGGTEVELAIVNLRQELGSWYRSQGYRECGTAPYDHRPATRACHLIRLRKSLAS